MIDGDTMVRVANDGVITLMIYTKLRDRLDVLRRREWIMVRMKQAVRYELIGYKQSKCCLRGSNTHGDSNEANGAKRQRIESVARAYTRTRKSLIVASHVDQLHKFQSMEER